MEEKMTFAYGIKIDKKEVNKYIDVMIGKVFKTLPLMEEDKMWKKHIETVIVELCGADKILLKNAQFITIVSKLEALKDVTDHELFKKTIFETTNLLKKFKYEVV